MKCSVNWVRLGLFSSFCSLAQSKTSGICMETEQTALQSLVLTIGTASSSFQGGRASCLPGRAPQSYLYLIEKLSIQQCQLLGYLVAVEIMQGSWPGTQHERHGWDRAAGCSSHGTFWAIGLSQGNCLLPLLALLLTPTTHPPAGQRQERETSQAYRKPGWYRR